MMRGGSATLATALVLGTLAPTEAGAQNPLTSWADATEVRYSATQPVLDYTVRIASGDTTGYDVVMHVGNAPDTFRVAMMAHPEYDDRYWRYVVNLRADAPDGAAVVSRVDSAVWQVAGSAGEVTLSYRLALPPAPAVTWAPPGDRASYRPFVSPTGALVGGPHTFMYVVGQSLAPAYVRLDVPAGWDVATGLQATVDPLVFFASTAKVLVESPILLGRLRRWGFSVAGTPHSVAYWPAPGAPSFDTTAFIDGIESVVRQAVRLFGRAPYRDYTFLLQDRAYGSLEHANSVTIGIPATTLAEDPREPLGEIAHEFFHAWNLMRIHPAEYGDVSWRSPPRSSGLWWSEGATMFYAHLLLRRAGLARGTRTDQLAGLMSRYYSTSGNHLLSPERVSRAAYGPTQGQLGDNTASTHLQGELLTTVLDLVIRSHTSGRRSMDDVMRAMMVRFSGPTGFTSDDIAREVAAACSCDMTGFFRAHVHGGDPLDFDRYLSLIGLASRVTWHPEVDSGGAPRPDLRVYGWQPADGSPPRLWVLDTTSVWERAGLHTGDLVRSVNGRPTPDLPSLLVELRSPVVGDSVLVEVDRPGGVYRAAFVMTGYRTASVTLLESPNATDQQRRLRDLWLSGESAPVGQRERGPVQS